MRSAVSARPLRGTVRGDEVLEDGEALTEVRLDRARDDLTTRVGHQATHAGDLAHLHDVAAGARADHHLDGVELLARPARSAMASVTWSVASVQISISFWRRSSSVMMPGRTAARPSRPRSSYLSRSSAFAAGVRTSAIEIVKPGAGRVLEAELLELVEARRPPRPACTRSTSSPTSSVTSRLRDTVVLEREVGRERLVEEQPAERGLHEHAAVAVAAGAPHDDRLGVCVGALGEALLRERACRACAP